MMQTAIKTNHMPTRWYKQFWPWFLIFLPLTAVIASIATIIIASKTTDTLVVDDYYKAGLAINQTLDRIELAKEYDIAARIHYANTLLSVTLTTRHPKILATTDTLVLKLIHPTLRSKDLRIKLKHAGNGRYIGHIAAQPDDNFLTSWYIQLEPANQNQTWRINGKIKMTRLSQLNNYKLAAN